MSERQVTGWVGWVFFAGFMMMLAGVFQFLVGLVAIFKDSVFLTSTGQLVWLDYTQWGWVHLLFGIVLFLSAFSVMGGHAWGRFFGAFLAAMSAIANFAFIQAYPIWSILVITMDVLIIYALLVHGTEAKE